MNDKRQQSHDIRQNENVILRFANKFADYPLRIGNGVNCPNHRHHHRLLSVFHATHRLVSKQASEWLFYSVSKAEVLRAPALSTSCYDHTQDTQGRVGRQKHSKLNHRYTLHNVTRHTILVVPICPNQIERREQFAGSMHDLRASF